MYFLGIVLAVIGFALLFYGFSKNNRKLLLIAGITLFLAGTLGDFISGFMEGVASQMPVEKQQGD